ncbi:MAG: YdiU family protein [Acidimicrobiia bacterium]
MTTGARTLFAFDDSFVRQLPALVEPTVPARPPQPALLALNEPLAAELGVDSDDLRSTDGIALLTGVGDGSLTPVAQAYAGHQFGGFNPRLGDGRAALLGEIIDIHGQRRDLHLKGSGATVFARGGDGKAAVGPMLREYVMGEAMHALGIPTTRALAVVATGEQIARGTMLPGAVLARVAASHLRVGTFQYAAPRDTDLLQRLADHAIARHHPNAAEAAHPYIAFYEAVVEAQASLVARWMTVGFIHGVMNTDNVTISGETIDYGPCAFMDAFDPATVFSSIDHGGRYAYGRQPHIAQWNMARLAEALLPLFSPDMDEAVAIATGVVQSFPERYQRHWRAGMRAKLGIDGGDVADGAPVDALITDILDVLHAQHIDFTGFFRSLSGAVRGDDSRVRSLFTDPAPFDAWAQRWLTHVDSSRRETVAESMDAVNPVYIARNHLVEAALDAATAGDLAPFEELVDVLRRPFDERPGLESFAQPAPPSFGPHQTFCGT